MPDPAPTPPTDPAAPIAPPSPTGRPLISARLAPYFGSAAGLCAVVAGASQIPGLHLPEAVFGWATLLASLFATLAGLTPGLRKVVPVLLCVLALHACAHQSPLVVTGESLDAAALTFEATAAGMASASDAHALTAAQVEAWNAFLPRFKASYHLACGLWRAARATQDQDLEHQAAAILTSLIEQLGAFSSVVLEARSGGAS